MQYLGRGGGISSNGDVVVVNSTIGSNLASHSSLVAGDGGGVYVAGGSFDMTHVTLAVNFAPNRGQNLYIADGGVVTSTNSIVATTDAIIGLNCHIETFDALVTAGANVADDTSCTGLPEGDPNLSTLNQHGDPLTFSYLLNAPSDGLDAADAAFCPDRDQRNYARPVGAGCDLGATEQNSVPLAIGLREVGMVDSAEIPTLLTFSILTIFTLYNCLPVQKLLFKRQ